MQRRTKVLSHALLGVALVAVATAQTCDSDRDPLAGSNTTVESAIAAVQVSGGASASVSEGLPPEGAVSALDPTIVPFASRVPNGGTGMVTVSAGQPFDIVNVGVAGRTRFYRVELPARVTTVDLLVTIAASQHTPFTTTYTVGRGSFDFGGMAEEGVIPASIQGGNVQVTATWALDLDLLRSSNQGCEPSNLVPHVDVDLFVTEPSGEVISSANSLSQTGGQLDGDANRNCVIPSPPVDAETVAWPSPTEAPFGDYTVQVNLQSLCDVSRVPGNADSGCEANFVEIDFTVTAVVGGSMEVFDGTLRSRDVSRIPSPLTVGSFCLDDDPMDPTFCP